jgi:hypothetical protein
MLPVDKARPALAASLVIPTLPRLRIPADCTMWKSFFLASGIFACVVGVEMLLIDSAVVVGMSGGESVFRAPDWMPWTLLSVGAATILHFCHLPATTGQTSE